MICENTHVTSSIGDNNSLAMNDTHRFETRRCSSLHFKKAVRSSVFEVTFSSNVYLTRKMWKYQRRRHYGNAYYLKYCQLKPCLYLYTYHLTHLYEDPAVLLCNVNLLCDEAARRLYHTDHPEHFLAVYNVWVDSELHFSVDLSPTNFWRGH